MYEAKKAETKQSKNSVKATQSKQSKARTKSKQTKNKHCKKGNSPKKKRTKKTKNQKTQAKGQQTERGACTVGARCYVEQVVVEWGNCCKNFKHFDCKFLYFKKVHTNPIIESINGDKCRSVPVIVLPCECFRVSVCV